MQAGRGAPYSALPTSSGSNCKRYTGATSRFSKVILTCSDLVCSLPSSSPMGRRRSEILVYLSGQFPDYFSVVPGLLSVSTTGPCTRKSRH